MFLLTNWGFKRELHYAYNFVNSAYKYMRRIHKYPHPTYSSSKCLHLSTDHQPSYLSPEISKLGISCGYSKDIHIRNIERKLLSAIEGFVSVICKKLLGIGASNLCSYCGHSFTARYRSQQSVQLLWPFLYY